MKKTILIAAVVLLAMRCFAGVTLPTEGGLLSRPFAVHVIFKKITPETFSPPAPISQPLPDYPRAMRLPLVQGFVILRFMVERDGHVVEWLVSKESNKAFGDAVRSVAKDWKYTPAEDYSGKPMASEIEYEIFFSIDEQPLKSSR